MRPSKSDESRVRSGGFSRTSRRSRTRCLSGQRADPKPGPKPKRAGKKNRHAQGARFKKTARAYYPLEDLQKNYEGYQEGVRAIMLKKQQEAAPNGIYGLVAEVIEAPESTKRR